MTENVNTTCNVCGKDIEVMYGSLDVPSSTEHKCSSPQ